MPQSELDRVVKYERRTLAESLALTARDFSEEARDAGYAPTLRLALSAKGGFLEIGQQISELLKDPDMLQKIIEEWGEVDRGVIFATGTPISNSMVELYTIQRCLQYDTLQEMGLIHFDD